MFALSKQVLRTGRTLSVRNFASVPIYIGNLSEKTTPETLREIFGSYGHIGGVRMNEGVKGYRYAHIYFTSGEAPQVNGQSYYMMEAEPTQEETASVQAAITKAVEERQDQVIDGQTVVVGYAKHRSRRGAPGPNTPNGARVGSNSGDVNGFSKGFSEGYRQGFSDAMANKA
ncbi:hypothetical protein BX661DRAFT_185695 [Kickxella alabastrina]|uniref:uncharacterized protein n=1 Tax=Kickxella alabastrina TaxID=61397 RepID=UPI002220F8E9|nr:uncharacterized protein BX661DRAFT_185695 [Kickxella alabastrina]KAI7824192.1 hypothetical protein BX661DRAFT_185695 [Kickxella alabastrina]